MLQLLLISMMKFLTYLYDLFLRQTTYISICLNEIYGRMKFVVIRWRGGGCFFPRTISVRMITIINIDKYFEICQTLWCCFLLMKNKEKTTHSEQMCEPRASAERMKTMTHSIRWVLSALLWTDYSLSNITCDTKE